MNDEISKNPFSPAFEAALDSVTTAPPAPVASPAAELPAVPTTAVAAAQNPLLAEAVLDAIKTVFDPEIPMNIYEIGLIYNVDVQPDGKVEVKMTLTSPGCPSAQELPVEVKDRVEAVAGVTGCDVEVVWDPTWTPSMMSDAARLQLGFF
ncbi:MAG: SUF system Fe-S cluster assembly protein [Acidobacteriota bacterium]